MGYVHFATVSTWAVQAFQVRYNSRTNCDRFRILLTNFDTFCQHQAAQRQRGRALDGIYGARRAN